MDGSSPNTTVTNATITITDDEKDAVTLSLNRPTLSEECVRHVGDGDGHGGYGDRGGAHGDGVGGGERDSDLGHGLHGGVGLHDHDRGERHERHGHVHPDADQGHQLNEGDETIGVAGTNSLSTVTGTTLTLIDDDQPTITLTSRQIWHLESWSGSDRRRLRQHAPARRHRRSP